MTVPGYQVLERLVAAATLIVGLVAFAVLVGAITRTVSAQMKKIENGTTRAAEKAHTLLLGWNQSTLRVVTQIAFLRRGYRASNRTFFRRVFYWLRVPPSSPIAKGRVVIMANNPGLTRAIMEQRIEHAFRERGISQWRNRIGWDFVCRVGDPTSVADLVRVSATNATGIVTMMTDEDHRECIDSNGAVVNGASIRTLLALRSLLAGSERKLRSFDTFNKRVVVQLQENRPYVEAACFPSPSGRKVVETIDITRFVNSLLFNCASKRGLSQVVMNCLNLEGPAMRSRSAKEIDAGPDGVQGFLIGKTFQEACSSCCWSSCVLVGISSSNVLYQDNGRLEGPHGNLNLNS